MDLNHIKAEYSTELSEKQERVVKNVLKLVNGQTPLMDKVEDELVKGRMLARHKSVVQDIFNTVIENAKQEE